MRTRNKLVMRVKIADKHGRGSRGRTELDGKNI